MTILPLFLSSSVIDITSSAAANIKTGHSSGGIIRNNRSASAAGVVHRISHDVTLALFG